MTWLKAAREESAELAADVAAERAWLELEGARAAQAAAERVRKTRKPELLEAWQVDAERLALRSTRPKRRRWRELDRLDADVDRLQHRHAEALERLREAEAKLERAPGDDARALAAWIASGERGERPGPSLYDRTVDRDACRMLADGVAVELERRLEQRVAYVERNRRKMVEEARTDVEALAGRYVDTVRSLAAIRDELLAARAVEIWANVFPHGSATEQPGHTPMVALGLLKPVRETLGLTTQISFERLAAALQADAETITSYLSSEQKAAAGIDESSQSTPEREAMWETDPRSEAWARGKLEHARMLAHGLNVDALGEELRG